MAELKTKATSASVAEYIASRASAEQAADCKALMAMFRKITGQAPKMWGPSIVGYGRFRYKYESGTSGEMPIAAFAIRGRELVVYITPESDGQEKLLARLGKHKMGKSCLYLKGLADIDKSVLEQLVVGCIDEVKRRYGPGSIVEPRGGL